MSEVETETETWAWALDWDWKKASTMAFCPFLLDVVVVVDPLTFLDYSSSSVAAFTRLWGCVSTTHTNVETNRKWRIFSILIDRLE